MKNPKCKTTLFSIEIVSFTLYWNSWNSIEKENLAISSILIIFPVYALLTGEVD